MNLRLFYLQFIVLFTSNFVAYSMQPNGLQLIVRNGKKTVTWADVPTEFNVINFCLDQGNIEDISNVMDDKGRRALHHATRANNNVLTRKLLRAGAEPNIQDERNNTPLMCAALYCYSDVVHDLLEHGAAATINTKNWAGDTALLFAVAKNDHESYFKVAHLLCYGANPNVLTPQNSFYLPQSPLSIALARKKFNYVRALMQAGASKELLLKCRDGEKLTQKLEVFAAEERLRIKLAQDNS